MGNRNRNRDDLTIEELGELPGVIEGVAEAEALRLAPYADPETGIYEIGPIEGLDLPELERVAPYADPETGLYEPGAFEGQ